MKIMKAEKIIEELEKDGWSLDNDFKANNMDFFQAVIEKALSKYQKSDIFDKEIVKLAFEKYPVCMVSIGDESKWDINEQYRDCWIEGYKDFLNDH